MGKNNLRATFKKGGTALGLCNMYPASGIIEGMCQGWDFVWIDGQHGEMSYDSILHAMQTCMGMNLEVMLRVPASDSRLVGMYADLSPAALMMPMIDTPEQAKEVVMATRFPPLGNRSYGGRRIIDLEGRDYYQDQHMIVVAQVETVLSVENASKIIATDGIDALFFSPDDMKVQMGLPINTVPLQNDLLKEAMRKVANAAKAAGKWSGCIAADAPSLQTVKAMGYQLVVGGGDIGFLRTAAAQKLEALREADTKSGKAEKGGGGVY